MAIFEDKSGLVITKGRKNVILFVKDVKGTAQRSQRGVVGAINENFQWILVRLLDLGLHSGRHVCKESAHAQTATLLTLNCSMNQTSVRFTLIGIRVVPTNCFDANNQ